MTTFFDQAHAWALKHPRRSANSNGTGPTESWQGYCQSLAWRISDAFGHGANPSFDSALHAAQASGPLNKDASKAPIGAFHYWGHGVGGEFGHVGVDLKGKGSWILMASSKVTTKWGDALGCISWKQYQDAIGDPKGAKYLGWSKKNGTGYINVPKPVAAAPAAAKPVVAPAAPAAPAKPVVAPEAAKPVTKPAAAPAAKPASKKKEVPVSAEVLAEQEKKVAALNEQPQTQNLGAILPNPQARRIAYAIFTGASVLVSNISIAYSALHAEFPGWLTVAIAVIGNLAVPFGALAIANSSPKKK